MKVAALELNNIFPSLLQHYREHPVGSVTVENPLEEAVTNLRASLSIKRYTDFPTQSEEVARLASGEKATLELPVVLNTEVFELQEDLPVQVEVTITYSAGGTQLEQTARGVVTIYRRTALTWDDSAKLCSFITPNESIVSTFAHRTSRLPPEAGRFRVPRLFLRAMRICDALGAYGINYVEDPDSPISGILGKSEVVDTVRFPRTTLLIRAGDCDDSTALLGSLLESAGISTAVVTSPGHVFLAFDTGEPDRNAWFFTTEGFAVIRHGGTVWIPVETTVVGEGFFSAWRTASSLVREHLGAGEVEFLPVSEQRTRYPPLPLPPSTFTVIEPEEKVVDDRQHASLQLMREELYGVLHADLEKRLARKRGTSALKLQNKIGVLQARFGEDRAAERTFKQAIDKRPSFVSSYVNLANLYLAQGKARQAVAALEQAREQRPGSALINLLLTQAYRSIGETAKAAESFAEVERLSPGLAERYGGLKQEGRETARAADARAEPLLLWDAGDDETATGDSGAAAAPDR